MIGMENKVCGSESRGEETWREMQSSRQEQVGR